MRRLNVFPIPTFLLWTQLPNRPELSASSPIQNALGPASLDRGSGFGRVRAIYLLFIDVSDAGDTQVSL